MLIPSPLPLLPLSCLSHPTSVPRIVLRLSHCNHALQMLKALKDAGVWSHRQLPQFLWSVQSFNTYNLRNTGCKRCLPSDARP